MILLLLIHLYYIWRTVGVQVRKPSSVDDGPYRWVKMEVGWRTWVSPHTSAVKRTQFLAAENRCFCHVHQILAQSLIQIIFHCQACALEKRICVTVNNRNRTLFPGNILWHFTRSKEINSSFIFSKHLMLVRVVVDLGAYPRKTGSEVGIPPAMGRKSIDYPHTFSSSFTSRSI